MNETKREIYSSLEAMQKSNSDIISRLTDRVCLSEYKSLCRKASVDGNPVLIWSDALNAALREHQVVSIPSSDSPYYIDEPVIIRSNRRIEAHNDAIIRQMPDVDVLMLRNENVIDGTHAQTNPLLRDENISIDGGCWEESNRYRRGYGRSGKFDSERSMYGVSTCMLFSAVNRLTLTNMTFRHTAGFSVQIGNASDIWCENILFESCYADGLHINGNTENIVTRHIFGEVGDDLVALNMYDWLDSSINFGTMKNVLCEDLNLYPSSPYKAIRIAPGVHWFDDGSTVECRAENIILKKVRGIMNFKMYLQTPGYYLGTEPEKAAIGGGDNIFFDDIEIDLKNPIDGFDNYLHSDPVTGYIAAFEIGSNFKTVTFENIVLTLHRDKYPLSNLLNVGPKSATCKSGNGQTYECFDPYLNCTVDKLVFKNININGEKPDYISDYIKVIIFDQIYDAPRSSGSGKVGKIVYDN